MLEQVSPKEGSMNKPADFDFTALSAPEKLLLAQQLVDSVLAEATPLTPSELVEMHRRAAAVDSGQAATESWESLRARLTARA